MSTTGKVMIHNREYKTVALRVQEFRETWYAHEGWAIITEIIERTDDYVVMKASIVHEGVTVATGYAEEQRKASQINRTSALENCETSAIGRALAAFGLGGSEYASANEVANAIHQQTRGRVNRQPQPRLTPDEQTYVTDTLKVIAVADHTDLEDLANHIKTKSPAVQNALRIPYGERQRFLKENPDAQSQPAVEG